MHQLKLEQRIDVPPERVFLAFTDPDLLSTWFTTRAEVDLRVGGHYANADGDRGTYLEVSAPSKLRFTWDNPGHCPHSEVTVRFTADGKQTHVELVHSKLASRESVEHMRSGWEWALANVKLFMETGNTVGYEEWLKRKAPSSSKVS